MLKDRGFEVECLARTKALYSKDIITTFRLRYPRFIHSELMTHRMFSRNASSSRAIPVTIMVDETLAHPIHWGLNKPGMQASEEKHTPEVESEWWSARDDMICHAMILEEMGYHKQIVNRLLEPFQFINVLVTATDWENFFTLRRSDLAQPEIHLLADMMFEELSSTKVNESNWHLPFNISCETLSEALIINTSKAAKISYNKDRMECSFEDYCRIHDMLWENGHMSPFEHCARCFDIDEIEIAWRIASIVDARGATWVDPMYCRNFRGFKSYRFILENGEKIQ